MNVAREGPQSGVVEMAFWKVTPCAAISDCIRGISRALTASWSSVMMTTMLRGLGAGAAAGWEVVGAEGDAAPPPQARCTASAAERNETFLIVPEKILEVGITRKYSKTQFWPPPNVYAQIIQKRERGW